MTDRGIALFAGTEADVVGLSAELAEGLGYASFWLNHPGVTDGIAGLASAARATSAIELGVGVVPLEHRDPASVVTGAKAASLPPERLLLGIGTSGPGAYRRARQGVAAIRDDLGCRVFMAALSEGACRLAGEIADGVLFNWLTPAHARRSAEWVGEGAERAGRPRPPLFAYVRVALGPDARRRVEAEGERYSRIGSYAGHFERMGLAPVDTAIPAAEAGEIGEGLRAWDGAVDAIVLRLLPSSEAVESHLELIRAGAPTQTSIAGTRDRASGEDAFENAERAAAEAAPGGLPRLKTDHL